MTPYDALSVCYDRLMDFDYAALCDSYERFFEKECRAPKTVLDLGCGTGKVTAELAKRGYDMTGVDTSEGMLMRARENTAAYPGVLLLNQDMRAIDLNDTVDCTVCALDGINHLARSEYLLRTFRRVHLFTNPGGYFIFDAHTHKKFFEILADNTFAYEFDDLFCCWQSSLAGRRLDYALDIFTRREDGKYDRMTDYFSEYYYGDTALEKLLREAGFRVADVDRADPERTVFFTVKEEIQ